MKRLAIGLALLTIGNMSVAQTTVNGWFAFNNMFKINEKFSVHLDVQSRSTNQLDHVGSFIFRPGLNWHFKKNLIGTVGYGYISNRRSVGGKSGYAPEHRIWQQLVFNHTASFVAIQHRLRLEQRFIGKFHLENGDFKTEGNHFANRLRYFTRAIIPLNGSKPFSRGVFAAVQDEVFVNLGDKTPVNGRFFDQNRLYLAAGYRVSAKFDLEAGYLNQYVEGRNRHASRAHIVQLATYLRL